MAFLIIAHYGNYILDINCFQRCFDDITQLRIYMEALACVEIFAKAENKRINLVWSFMHEDEIDLCPFLERKKAVIEITTICDVFVGPEDIIYDDAKRFQHESNLSAKDSIHLACAKYAKSKYFLTCDDVLIKQSKNLKIDFQCMNPIEYILKGK